MFDTDESKSKDRLISLPPDLLALLEELGRRTGEPVAGIVERAIRSYVRGRPKPDNSVYLSAPVNAMMKGFYRQNTAVRDFIATATSASGRSTTWTARWSCSTAGCTNCTPTGTPARWTGPCRRPLPA